LLTYTLGANLNIAFYFCEDKPCKNAYLEFLQAGLHGHLIKQCSQLMGWKHHKTLAAACFALCDRSIALEDIRYSVGTVSMPAKKHSHIFNTCQQQPDEAWVVPERSIGG